MFCFPRTLSLSRCADGGIKDATTGGEGGGRPDSVPPSFKGSPVVLVLWKKTWGVIRATTCCALLLKRYKDATLLFLLSLFATPPPSPFCCVCVHAEHSYRIRLLSLSISSAVRFSSLLSCFVALVTAVLPTNAGQHPSPLPTSLALRLSSSLSLSLFLFLYIHISFSLSTKREREPTLRVIRSRSNAKQKNGAPV